MRLPGNHRMHPEARPTAALKVGAGVRVPASASPVDLDLAENKGLPQSPRLAAFVLWDAEKIPRQLRTVLGGAADRGLGGSGVVAPTADDRVVVVVAEIAVGKERPTGPIELPLAADAHDAANAFQLAEA